MGSLPLSGLLLASRAIWARRPAKPAPWGSFGGEEEQPKPPLSTAAAMTGALNAAKKSPLRPVISVQWGLTCLLVIGALPPLCNGCGSSGGIPAFPAAVGPLIVVLPMASSRAAGITTATGIAKQSIRRSTSSKVGRASGSEAQHSSASSASGSGTTRWGLGLP
ncbi:hypothetical protein VaNZ11_012978 [Volvox africanus]|uniref:Uncharacterized protein n=1 Tax=Volvox africanus TaxID=51714 RepID=A0ABQ5SF29_9CHLO|nr:hypothetical protein VaNZ11_012978 [Volvox africanus]